MPDSQETTVSRVITAPAREIWRAFTEPEMLVAWQAPGDMTATVHAFDLRAGGGYTMSLTYPVNEPGAPGKTTDR